MTTKASLPPSEIPDIDDDDTEEASPACVLVFNASDPSGAGGLTGDITSIAAVMRDAVCFFTLLPPAYTETATIAGRISRSPSRYPFWNTSQTLSLS